MHHTNSLHNFIKTTSHIFTGKAPSVSFISGNSGSSGSGCIITINYIKNQLLLSVYNQRSACIEVLSKLKYHDIKY